MENTILRFSGKIIALVGILLISGCAVSPVPKNVIARRASTQKFMSLSPVLEEGDILFRLGDAQAGSANFSELVARISDSDFSHAVFIYKITDEDVIVADVSILGVERQFLQDWFMRGSKNLVVKRIADEYRYLLPQILEELDRIIKEDGLYDEFFTDPNKFYCTEVIDHCFRKVGLPLADKIKIKDMPKANQMIVITFLAKILANVDPNTPVVVAGNDEIGLFSSPYLKTVVDFR